MQVTVTTDRVMQTIEQALARDIPPKSIDEEARDGFDFDPRAHVERGYPIARGEGEMLYALARAIGARRIVEFATSIGISTMYLASAVRDNGGGLVIGAELVGEKVQTARANLEAAGLGELADIREGDALQTLRDVEGPIDLVLLDGWPDGQSPSLDCRVTQLLAPKMRVGAIVYNDNGEADVAEYLSANGFYVAHLAVDPDRGTAGHLAIKLKA